MKKNRSRWPKKTSGDCPKCGTKTFIQEWLNGARETKCQYCTYAVREAEPRFSIIEHPIHGDPIDVSEIIWWDSGAAYIHAVSDTDKEMLLVCERILHQEQVDYIFQKHLNEADDGGGGFDD